MNSPHTDIDALIKEVAIKHNISLSPDDPIMILPTINRLLLSETEAGQQALLQQFKEELENLLMRTQKDVSRNAEAILLTSTKHNITEIKETIEEALDSSIERFINLTNNEYRSVRLYTILAIISSTVSLSTALLLLFK